MHMHVHPCELPRKWHLYWIQMHPHKLLAMCVWDIAAPRALPDSVSMDFAIYLRPLGFRCSILMHIAMVMRSIDLYHSVVT